MYWSADVNAFVASWEIEAGTRAAQRSIIRDLAQLARVHVLPSARRSDSVFTGKFKSATNATFVRKRSSST